MVGPIKITNKNLIFRAKPENNEGEREISSEILPNTLKTRVKQTTQRTEDAFIHYPVKGLAGDINSDFYEFLTMGTVPYLVGSVTLAALFNLVNKHLLPENRKMAQAKGYKLALGVAMFGLFKGLSSNLITKPVKWGTGVDIDLPVQHVYYSLPTKPGKDAEPIPIIQQRKVYDSREFFRKDLIQKDLIENNIPYYDNIAKKLGMGDNLNDAATETIPIIQNIVSTTKTAKSLATFAWAGVGVGLSSQDSWNIFFNSFKNRKKFVATSNMGFGDKLKGRFSTFGKNSLNITKAFGNSFGKACKTLWTGEAGKSGFMKHAGKSWLLFTAALTIGGVVNTIARARNMGNLVNKDVIDKSKESTVI